MVYNLHKFKKKYKNKKIQQKIHKKIEKKIQSLVLNERTLIARDALQPQATYPCGICSHTSSFAFQKY